MMRDDFARYGHATVLEEKYLNSSGEATVLDGDLNLLASPSHGAGISTMACGIPLLYTRDKMHRSRTCKNYITHTSYWSMTVI